jgi:hypothetical protein
MVSVPDKRPPGMVSPPVLGRMARRFLLGAIACAVLALIVVALMVVRPWSDPNHQSAENVVRHAGIPAGVTPGPRP